MLLCIFIEVNLPVLTTFFFKVEVRYNLPTTEGEACKFNITTVVAEIKEKEPENIFGPVQDEADDEKEDKKRVNERKGKGDRKRKRCKGKDKNKKKCKGKDKGKKPDKQKPKPRPPQKHQPVKSIRLRVCTR